MSLAERLLRRILGDQKASAVLGDIYEDGARSNASRRWVARQAIAYALRAACLSAERGQARTRAITRLGARDAWRNARRFPGTSGLAFGILALSISAATITFSVVDHVVLRPLPYPHPERLISIHASTTRESRSLPQSVADYLSWRDGASTLEGIAAWLDPSEVRITRGGQSEAVHMVSATADLFAVTRVRPVVGMPFRREHERAGHNTAAVISHRLWKRHFGGSADVVGRTVSTASGDLTILGVMPQGFNFPAWQAETVDVWRPLGFQEAERIINRKLGVHRYLRVLGRLRDGVGVEQARADVERITAATISAHPGFYSGWKVGVMPMLDVLTERFRGWMLLVLGAVAAVVAIACANVANLLLARATVRQREVAVRAAMGATRAQILGGLMVEGVLLAAAAASAGVIVAFWGVQAVAAALPPGIPRAAGIAVDLRVLGAAVGASFATAVAFAAVPAWQSSRAHLSDVMKSGSSSTVNPTRPRWRSILLVGQIGLSCVLLVATTLLVGSFLRVVRADLGFARENLLGVRVTPLFPASMTDRQAGIREMVTRAEDVVRRVPGVSGVARLLGNSLPLFQEGSATTTLSLPGSATTPLSADWRRVSHDYFAVAGIRILRGRAFVEADRGARVMILDELAARALFGEREPVGASLLSVGSEYRVVGVASNVRLLGPEGPIQPQAYSPLFAGATGGTVILLIRSSAPAAQTARAVESALRSTLPAEAGVGVVQVVDDAFRELTADRRFNAGLMSAFGIFALLVGAAGIYGVTASIVAQQTREIGVRMALGASTRRIVSSIAATTGRLIFTGMAIGLTAAWAASGLLESVLFGIRSRDALPYLVPFVVLSLAGTMAALFPAIRASRIDPLITLRTE